MMIVSGGFDGTLRLWDTSNGQLVRTIVDRGDIESVAWSPDGRLIASTSQTAIRIWPGSTDELLEHVRHDIRLFTPSIADCKRYYDSSNCPAVR
jgi:WD40 repeat protein